MASKHFICSVSETPVSDVEKSFISSPKHGSDLRFLGVVRDTEDQRPIFGIDYSHHPGMAEQELCRIAEAMGEEFPSHQVLVHHTVGFVAAGVASIVIRVQTPHSSEGMTILTEYLKRIKTTVPIWKKICYE